jgi:hypothetical protein
MHAKMSCAPRRLAPDAFGCATRSMSERVAGIEALAELRAILAETEAAGVALPCETRNLPLLNKHMLREELRAFVGEGDQ